MLPLTKKRAKITLRYNGILQIKRQKLSKSQRPLSFDGKYRGAAYSICKLRFNVSKEIHNASNYDYN